MFFHTPQWTKICRSLGRYPNAQRELFPLIRIHDLHPTRQIRSENSPKLLTINGHCTETAGEKFKFICEKASVAGVTMMVDSIIGSGRLDIEEFRVFVLLDDVAPLIFVNRNDSDNAMLFSLLHEITHVLPGKAEVFKR